MQIRKERSWLERGLPKGYGIAYRDYVRGTDILYPVPLNYLIGPLRELLFKLARGRRHKELERAYQRGYEDAGRRWTRSN